jgi:general secretion pathway protein K
MRHGDPRRGVILPTVLWSIALLSALAMAAAVTFRSFAGIMAAERDRVQGDALLSAGLETAAGLMNSPGDAPLMEIETTVNLATGSARLRLNDEGGRIDIGKAPAIVLVALLRSVGAPEGAANDIALRIVDRRNSDTTTRSGQARRLMNGPPKTPGTGRPFSDLQQLRFIPGMAAEWLSAIEPLTTVFGSETVNPLTAPAGVIAALPGVGKGDVDTFLKTRRSFPADVDRLVRAVGGAQQYLAAKPQRVASVELMAELTDGYAVAARAVIVVLPQDSEPYRVLVWTPVPAAGLL